MIPGGVVLALVLFAAVAPGFLTHLSPLLMGGNPFGPPSPHHLLGTDEFGRDILARIIYGTRPEVEITVGAVLIAGLLGTPLGIIGGYQRGVVEVMTSSAVNILISFPPIVLAMFVVAFLGPGVLHLTLIIGFLYISVFARLAFAQTVAIRDLDYVEAARAIGDSNLRIIWSHILPNVLGPLIVQASLSASTALLLASGLSYLGLGVVPPTANWGEMIATAQRFLLVDPRFALWPSLALTLTILAINSLGDVLRDYLDPRSRTRASAF